jgi:hypothetical protein
LPPSLVSAASRQPRVQIPAPDKELIAMASIKGTVGKNGNNDFGDSVLVQALLNNFVLHGWLKEPGKGPIGMLVMDGQPGKKTQDAIEVFQRVYMTEIGSCNLRVVEPHSDTLARLNKLPAPPKGPYGGACPTLPPRPDLDDPAGDPHIVYHYDQEMYTSSGVCLAMAAKWLHLRGAGKDFLYDPVNLRAGPPGSDVFYAQEMPCFRGKYEEADFIALLAQFRLNKSTPEFVWEQSDIGVQGGTWAAHLVARHPGRYLHTLDPSVPESGHAVAYEVSHSGGKSVFRFFDANVGHWLCHSGGVFVDVIGNVFTNMHYASYNNGTHRLLRVQSF